MMAAPGITPRMRNVGADAIDARPDTRPRTLMFVAGVKGSTLALAAVGDETTQATIKTNMPAEILVRMIGRWVWVRGEWGGNIEIEKWVDLPKWSGN